MLAKSCGTGSSFMGLGRYLAYGKDGQTPERLEWSEGVNISTNDPVVAAQIMWAESNNNTRCDKPVYHFSINFHEAETEKLNPDLMKTIAKDTLKDLGLEKHQAMLVCHNDTEHPHLHVMVNRIDPENKLAWKQGLDKIALEKSMARQALEHDLALVPGYHNSKDLGIEGPNTAEQKKTEVIRFEERTGEKAFVSKVRDLGREPFDQAKSWDDLSSNLEKEGLRIEAKGRGLIITDGQNHAKPSSIEREFSRANLEEKFQEKYTDYQKRTGQEIKKQDSQGKVTGEDLKLQKQLVKDLKANSRERSKAVKDEADKKAIKDIEKRGKEIRKELSKVDRKINGPDFAERTAARLKPVFDQAQSWKELEKNIRKSGLVLDKKGRGLVVTDGANELKLSQIERKHSIHGLEKKFKQTWRDHSKSRNSSIQQIHERKTAITIDQAVKKLEEHHKKVDQLKGLYKEKSRINFETKPSADLLKQTSEQKQLFLESFKGVYMNPEGALKRFEKMRKKRGFENTLKTFIDSPTTFGVRAGVGVSWFGNKARDKAYSAFIKTEEWGKAYGESLDSLKERREQIDKDMKQRKDKTISKKIDALEKQVGYTFKDRLDRSFSLERNVLNATQGKDGFDLQNLPGVTSLRAEVLKREVNHLREAQEKRFSNLNDRDPRVTQGKSAELPKTATPNEERAFKAVKDYKEAAKGHSELLGDGKAKDKDIKTAWDKTLKSAGKIAGNYKAHQKWLIAHGVDRHSLRDDMNHAKRAGYVQATRQQTIKPKAPRVAKTLSKGKGIGLKLKR